jgi:hypothetical protein
MFVEEVVNKSVYIDRNCIQHSKQSNEVDSTFAGFNFRDVGLRLAQSSAKFRLSYARSLSRLRQAFPQYCFGVGSHFPQHLLTCPTLDRFAEKPELGYCLP